MNNSLKKTSPPIPLFLILCLFTVTFFIYRDFGIRMIFGFGALGLILAAGLLQRLFRNQPPAVDPLRLSVLVLSAAVFLSFLRPDSRHDADSLSFVIAMVICCAFVLLADPGRREAKQALWVCFLGGGAMSAFVLFFQCFPQLFWDGLFHRLSETARLYLQHYVPKGYAITLGGCTYTNYIIYLGISVGCAYIVCRKFDWRSAVASLLCALSLTALTLVGRRGELLGAVACLALLVLACVSRRSRRFLIIGGAVCVVAAVAIIIPLLPWLRQFQPLIRYVMTFEQLLSGQDVTSGRMELYVLALNAFLESPVFGIGFDQFHTLIPQEFLALHGQDVEDVHCIYLQFFTETGIVGAPFLIAPLLYGYYLVCSQFARLKRTPEADPVCRMLCVSSFLMQSFLLVLGIYDPNFQRVVFWCFYALSSLMLLTALKLEGYRPADPVSRLLERFLGCFVPVCRRIWDLAGGVFSRLKKGGPPMTRHNALPLTLILAVFTCTFFFYRDFGSRMIYGYALLGVLLMVHLLQRLRRDEPLELTGPSLAFGALALVILVHFLLPNARRDADTASYQISMLICAAYAISAQVRERQTRLADRAMYLGAMAMAVFVMVFTLLPELFRQTVYPLLSQTARTYYDYFQPQGYGASLGTYSYTDYVLFLGLAVCCADLAAGTRTRRRVTIDLLSMAFLGLAMIVLGRRGELLAAVVSAVVFSLYMCSRKKRRIVLILGSLLCALGVTLVLTFLPQLSKIPVLTRYVETVEQLLSGADVTSARGLLLAAAVGGFRMKPVFGVGWGKYMIYASYIGMCDTDGNLIEDCHNIYMQFLCETGIVGTVLILTPVFYLLATTCRMLCRAKYLEDKTPLRFASISFLIQFFLLFLGIYDPSFQKIVFWCFYALSVCFLKAAMASSGWHPGDPVSRGLDRLAGWLAVPGRWLWRILRTPWKEGK